MSEMSQYRNWLGELKKRYRATQIKAAIAVNGALIEFYWELGRDICRLYPGKKRGISFFANLSHDLQVGVDDPKGLSERNIRYALAFYELYSYLQQVVADNDGDGNRTLQVADDNDGNSNLQQVVANVVEYALADSERPMGVAQYSLKYTAEPPEDLREIAPTLAKLGPIVDETIAEVKATREAEEKRSAE